MGLSVSLSFWLGHICTWRQTKEQIEGTEGIEPSLALTWLEKLVRSTEQSWWLSFPCSAAGMAPSHEQACSLGELYSVFIEEADPTKSKCKRHYHAGITLNLLKPWLDKLVLEHQALIMILSDSVPLRAPAHPAYQRTIACGQELLRKWPFQLSGLSLRTPRREFSLFRAV